MPLETFCSCLYPVPRETFKVLQPRVHFNSYNQPEDLQEKAALSYRAQVLSEPELSVRSQVCLEC